MNANEILFTVFGWVSFLLAVFFVVYSVYLYRKGKRAKRVLSSVQMCTLGIFLSVVLIFIPIYYTNYRYGDEHYIFRPLLLAIHNALRVFILDGDFDTVVCALEGQNTWTHVSFSLYAAVLYVAAPLLTFGNVLSLFKSVSGEIRYRWHRYKKHYIMSELNEKSIALAKDLRKREPRSVIVFTDVFEQNEEDDYELLTEARDINAICLKKDIAHLDFVRNKGAVEIFLIGNDVSENVSQAVKITGELNEKHSKYNVKIFVFSTEPSAAYIVDSIRYDNLISHAGNNDYSESCFKLRRIDEKRQLIWNTVPKMKLFKLANAFDKKLCVTILGFGSYGMEFFKTLIWYFQFDGYRLEVNIVDKKGKDPKEKDDIESLINRHCPELLKKNCSDADGEAHYDIRIFSGVDVSVSDLDELLLYDGTDDEKLAASKRLRATNLAFVSLGDDNANIETSIHLRSLFDRVNGVSASKDFDWMDEAVDIYSVVYDDQKSSILFKEADANTDSHLLVNHRNVPYHIRFIGSMSSQFNYDNIYDGDLERDAYKHHTGWVDIEASIYTESGCPEKAEKLKASQTPEAAALARQRYEQYEYYRLSSIAKELYQREIKNNPVLLDASVCLKRNGKQTCECPNCVRRKKSEHMRWNAYTRLLGFSYSESRADRALLHNDLRSWGELSDFEKKKD